MTTADLIWKLVEQLITKQQEEKANNQQGQKD